MPTSFTIKAILCIFFLFLITFVGNFFQFVIISLSFFNLKVLPYGSSFGFVDVCTNSSADFDAFLSDFVFGASSSAYQIEGGWNSSGRGPSVWDVGTHQHPERIKDGSNGDIACDSYNRFEEDIAALKEVGFKSYRFSISWSRILPFGDTSKVNQAGLDYYHRLVDALIEAEIEPVVTMHHYDTPQSLQDIGGPTNSIFAEYFEDYANILFDSFGDKVKTWMTFNEPEEVCVSGYGNGNKPPFIRGHGIAEYLCAHNILIAHARAYRLYDLKYRKTQKGRIGMPLATHFYYPLDSKQTDPKLVDQSLQFFVGWFAHPIFSKDGGYPDIMVEIIANNSKLEGRSQSRLPEMSKPIKRFIQGTADFFAMNYYTSSLVSLLASDTKKEGFEKDMGVEIGFHPDWIRSQTFWLRSVPQGFRDALNWIKNEYNNPEIWVTENGWSDDTDYEDNGRIQYMREHMQELLKAQKCDGVRVTRYCAWSIIDNFEWLEGYTEKFGLYRINFTSPNRERIPRKSASFMRNVIKNKQVPQHYVTLK